MHLKNSGIGQKAIIGITLVLFVTAGSLIRKSISTSGDTTRVGHIQNIALSIRAQSLGKDDMNKYFYPTHFALHKSLLKGNFDIPDPYGNICYFIGTVQNKTKKSSDFVILTWGNTKSTLDPNTPGILYETSSPLIEKVLKSLSPTIDKKHFQCNQTAHIPWKKDMSPLLRMNLFPSHWLKINQKKQICLGINDQNLEKDLIDCIPDETIN